LIRGESGTGKELVARAIHCNSHRRKEPFVAINCAAIPEALIESELFGHEKGSFTGADKKKIGKFEFAGAGTIFLDELGELNVSMQAKLLRVLQENVVTPVGANKDVKVRTRILAATNQPLEEMMQAKTFREDLFYRLNILPIILPPLRERREDIPSLVEFMIAKFNNKHKRSIKGIDKEALAKLLVYNWPGNIRELENAVERSFICESSDKLTLDSLPPNVCQQRAGATAADTISDGSFFGDENLDYPTLKDKFEREFILRALTAFRGKINQTAQHTNMTKVTLLRKLQKFSIDPKSFY
jgi:transcriptional regulator with PAS, ATPase and Fis domain